jgi:uncharacterized repeat protein (TIGR02543 family)
MLALDMQETYNLAHVDIAPFMANENGQNWKVVGVKGFSYTTLDGRSISASGNQIGHGNYGTDGEWRIGDWSDYVSDGIPYQPPFTTAIMTMKVTVQSGDDASTQRDVTLTLDQFSVYTAGAIYAGPAKNIEKLTKAYGVKRLSEDGKSYDVGGLKIMNVSIICCDSVKKSDIHDQSFPVRGIDLILDAAALAPVEKAPVLKITKTLSGVTYAELPADYQVKISYTDTDSVTFTKQDFQNSLTALQTVSLTAGESYSIKEASATAVAGYQPVSVEYVIPADSAPITIGTDSAAIASAVSNATYQLTVTNNYTKTTVTPPAPETYTVKYEYTGTVPTGAPALPASVTDVTAGVTVTVEDPKNMAMDGYTFNGWYLDTDTVTSFKMPAKNVTLTGSYTRDTAGITVNKTFSGLTEAQIAGLADTFTLTVTDAEGSTHDLKLSEAEHEGSTYYWALEKVPTGIATITETGASVSGMTLRTAYQDGDAGVDASNTDASMDVGAPGCDNFFGVTNTYAPTPVTPPSNPGDESGYGPGENPLEQIPDEETPLTDIPENVIPTAEQPVETTEIGEEPVAKAVMPTKTGDALALWIAAAGVSGIGLAYLVLSGRKRREDAE